MEPNKQPWSADNNGHEAAEDAVQVMSNTTTPAKNGSNNKPDKKVYSKFIVVNIFWAGVSMCLV